ncbi:hypothetical protein GOBAR_DD21608 [Gossypium barbadense]|nr:hypothetical protein GOBAR_DD21608 [Gossypium barbadense]
MEVGDLGVCLDVAEALRLAILKAKDSGLIYGLSGLVDGFYISYLQFADDTIVFLEGDVLFAIGIDEAITTEVVDLWGCGINTFPLMYLGIPLGVNPHKVRVWGPAEAWLFILCSTGCLG